VSPEHEVSVISAHQAIAAMDRRRFEPVGVYVGKDGAWFTGSVVLELDAYSDLDDLRARATRVHLDPAGGGRLALVPVRKAGWFTKPGPSILIDVVLPAFHGGSGEDGGVQGLCEMFGVPYAGSGVPGSSLGMDKVLSKVLSRAAGIPVVDFIGLREDEWTENEEACLDRIVQDIGVPAMIKPARLGSSIGIAMARDRTSLDSAIEDAFRYDSKVIVERAVEQLKEVNCSVLGSADSIRLSALEQPIRSSPEELLTFADKYQRGGGRGKVAAGGSKSGAVGMASLDRIIPAPLPAAMETEIRTLAEKIFRLHDCSGVVRIDFLIDEASDSVYFNEVNTIPGSFAFYLWEPAGMTFPDLVTHLIQQALARHKDTKARVRSYDVNLLSAGSIKGLKGAKRSS
jgi:D-alanine-D-alanine ligase